MAKSRKQKDTTNSDLHSKERDIPIQKKTLLPGVGKKLKKNLKKLHADAVLDFVTKSPPTFSALQEHPKLKKKKKKDKRNKKKDNTKKWEVGNNLPLQKLFHGVANVNDFGENQVLTDTKSFFKPEILIPEECIIQFANPCVSPKYAANVRLSDGKEDAQSIEQQGSQSDENVESVEELDLEINIKKDKNHAIVEDKDHTNIEDTFIEENTLQFHRLPKNKFLVVMKRHNNLFIHGQVNVRVLFGSVEILGWCANDTSDTSLTLFSPRGCSYLSIEPLEHSSENLSKVKSVLTTLGMDSSLTEEIVSELDKTSSLVIFEKSESTLGSFLSLHVPSISLYPHTLQANGGYLQIESVLKCQIQSKIIYGHCHEKSQDWEELAEVIADDFNKKGHARVVACGGKSVGKSTLLRFLMNRIICAHGEVLYLDFDPGQPEFTVPGCVYAIRVTEPMFGPNYTHVRTPERCVYIGHVDVDDCPDRYIQGVRHIIDYCESIPELHKMVWLVNTMGYNKGLGVEMNTSIIGLVNPNRVVQIVSQDSRRNFLEPLLPENVLKLRGRWCKPPARLDFKLFQLQSLAETHGQSTWGLQAAVARNYMQLAFFHQMLGKTKQYLSDLIPYSTPLSRLTLSVLHETLLPKDVLSVMNGMLVALCKSDPDAEVLTPEDASLPRVLVNPPVCPCLGFGVVRGIDVSSRTLYLTTVLPASRLSEVDCLATGAVPLPPSLLQNPKVGPGVLPYVIVGPGQVTGRLVKRKYIVPRA